MATACVTGASSGIGREFAIRLSKMGYNLILVSRNTKELKKLAAQLDTKCMIISCDLSDEKACCRLAQRLRRYRLVILINNAGFGDIGKFHETRFKKDLDMINVNIKATHILTKALLPGFIRRDCGYILNVASCAGLMPGGPYMATYYATKAYITSLTNAVYQELHEAGSRVQISMLCPGPVDTNFNQAANVAFSLPGISPGYCADYALRQMFRGKTVIIPTLPIKAAVFAVRLVPRKIMLAMTARQQKKKQ